jgi:hypothetical protein
MDGTQAQQAQKKEPQWYLAQHEWCRPGMNVEFVTEFGVRHIGTAILLVQQKIPPRSRHPVMMRESVLLMSEDTEHLEYFTIQQVEKWRETDERVPKKRFLGQTFPDTMEHFGVLTPLFVTYLNLRFEEKKKELKAERNSTFYDIRPLSSDTEHFENEDGKQQWETPFACGKFIEVEGDECIVVEFSGKGSENECVKKYSFKEVARAAEDICRHFFEQDHY